MRFKEAYEGSRSGCLTHAEAALLLGVCDRTFRRGSPFIQLLFFKLSCRFSDVKTLPIPNKESRRVAGCPPPNGSVTGKINGSPISVIP